MRFRLEEVASPFDQSEGVRDLAFFNYPNPGGAKGSLDVEGQDGVRAAIEWRKPRQSRKNPPSVEEGEEREERAETPHFRFPLPV